MKQKGGRHRDYDTLGTLHMKCSVLYHMNLGTFTHTEKNATNHITGNGEIIIQDFSGNERRD